MFEHLTSFRLCFMTLIKNRSVYMTVSISVERYVAIFYPLVYKVMMVMVAMMS